MKIDARLLAPGQLYLDPFGHVEFTPIKVKKIQAFDQYPHADRTGVPVVRLVGVRADDGVTEIVRLLDLGAEVEVVPTQPDIHVSFDVATRTWAILIDTTPCGSRPGDLNLNVFLNDAELFDGDPEAPVKPEPPQKGDRVRLSGHTAILRYNVDGLLGTVRRIHGDGTANVALDQEFFNGILNVEINLDQLTKIV